MHGQLNSVNRLVKNPNHITAITSPPKPDLYPFASPDSLFIEWGCERICHAPKTHLWFRRGLESKTLASFHAISWWQASACSARAEVWGPAFVRALKCSFLQTGCVLSGQHMSCHSQHKEFGTQLPFSGQVDRVSQDLVALYTHHVHVNVYTRVCLISQTSCYLAEHKIVAHTYSNICVHLLFFLCSCYYEQCL